MTHHPTTHPLHDFDLDAVPLPSDDFLGIPFTRETARVILIPAPFDASCSQHAGASDGPDAIRAASSFLDVQDRRFGPIYERGIWMAPTPEHIRKLSADTRKLVTPLMKRGGATPEDTEDLRRINEACREMNAYVFNEVTGVLHEGKVPGVIGGEHSVTFGAIKAASQHFGPIGVLQFDAHMDLRVAYGGLTWSHASVMYNVVREIQDITRLVQVGIRDFCPGELAFAERRDAIGGQIVKTFYDDDMFDEMAWGTPFGELCERIIDSLPRRVWVTFDIDALIPSLCPNTGTPVPGGLTYGQAGMLIQMLGASDREVVGFDLVEVAPKRAGEPFDINANVGARMLYRLCSLAK